MVINKLKYLVRPSRVPPHGGWTLNANIVITFPRQFNLAATPEFNPDICWGWLFQWHLDCVGAGSVEDGIEFMMISVYGHCQWHWAQDVECRGVKNRKEELERLLNKFSLQRMFLLVNFLTFLFWTLLDVFVQMHLLPLVPILSKHLWCTLPCHWSKPSGHKTVIWSKPTNMAMLSEYSQRISVSFRIMWLVLTIYSAQLPPLNLKEWANGVDSCVEIVCFHKIADS